MPYQILFYKGRNEEEVSLIGSITPADEKTNNYFKELLSGARYHYILYFTSNFETHPHGFLDLSLPYKPVLAENTLYILSENYSFLTEEQFKNKDAVNALIERLPLEKIKKMFKD